MKLLFDESSDDESSWQIPSSCPSSIVYSHLHPFIKSSEITRTLTKTRIGQFYCRIYPFIATRKFRPDNAFRFVERLVSHSRLKYDSSVDLHHDTEGNDIQSKFQHEESTMQYSLNADAHLKLTTSVDESTVGKNDPPPYATKCCPSNWAPRPAGHSEQHSYARRNVIRKDQRKKQKINDLKLKLKRATTELKASQKKVKKGLAMISTLTQNVETLKLELDETYQKLQKSENELRSVKKKECSRTRTLELIEDDFCFSEGTIADLLEANKEMKRCISTMEEVHTVNSTLECTAASKATVTKTGKHYSLPIRRLYYDLLANHVPASKVSNLVKLVVKCFIPDVDIANLKLPKDRCVGYMRKEELYTVQMAQKAHIFNNEIEALSYEF